MHKLKQRQYLGSYFNIGPEDGGGLDDGRSGGLDDGRSGALETRDPWGQF